MSNEDVKKLRQELLDRGYTPKVSDAEAAYQITVSNGTVTQEATSVVMPFNPHGIEGNASVVWAKSNGKEEAHALIQSYAKYLTEPMDILKANDTYQAIVENLTGQGYVVDEENAKVTEVIKTDLDVASMLVKATGENDTKYILASIDIQSGTVLSVSDVTCEDVCYWFCTIGCFMSEWYCVILCCVFAPPFCGLCGIICPLIAVWCGIDCVPGCIAAVC